MFGSALRWTDNSFNVFLLFKSLFLKPGEDVDGPSTDHLHEIWTNKASAEDAFKDGLSSSEAIKHKWDLLKANVFFLVHLDEQEET